MTEIMAETVKRGRGRPKGYPKTGGRVKGSPPKTHLRDASRILQKLAGGEPMMMKSVMGKPLMVVPTFEMRIRASSALRSMMGQAQ